MEEQNQNQTLEFFNIMDQIEGSHNGSINDEERGQLLFSLSMPGFDMVLDQIMEDEFADFNKLIGEQDNLLILRDY